MIFLGNSVMEDFDLVENVIFWLFWEDGYLLLKLYYEDFIKLKDVLGLDGYLEGSEKILFLVGFVDL